MSTNMLRVSQKRTKHGYDCAEALSSDSCGPMPTVGMGGERQFVTFIDVKKRFAAEIPIVRRDEIPELNDAAFNNF